MAKYLTNSPEARALLAESDTKDVIRYGMIFWQRMEVGVNWDKEFEGLSKCDKI